MKKFCILILFVFGLSGLYSATSFEYDSETDENFPQDGGIATIPVIWDMEEALNTAEQSKRFYFEVNNTESQELGLSPDSTTYPGYHFGYGSARACWDIKSLTPVSISLSADETMSGTNSGQTLKWTIFNGGNKPSDFDFYLGGIGDSTDVVTTAVIAVFDPADGFHQIGGVDFEIVTADYFDMPFDLFTGNITLDVTAE